MALAARLMRPILSLPELELRMRWVEDALTHWPVARAAPTVNALLELSAQAVPRAREALLPICLLLVREHGATWVQSLRQAALEQQLLGLERLTRRGSPASDSVRASEAPPQIPDYGLGREVTVGERRSLARRNNRQLLERLLLDPHPLVLRQLLENPRLTELDLVRVLARRPPHLDAVREIANTTWLARERLRLALIQNPYTPLPISVPLLAVCMRPELKQVVSGTDMPLVLRATANEYLERLPPLRKGSHTERQ